MIRNLRHRVLVLAALSTGAAALAVACGDDDDNAPASADAGGGDTSTPDSSVQDTGTGADTSTTTDAGTDATADANDANDAGDGAAAPGFYAIDSANNLVTFQSATPGTVTTKAITGLQVAETIVGIDFRRTDGKLYGLGSTSRLYRIDTATGAATAIGVQFSTLLTGTSFAFDWNPVPDRFRIVSDTDQNLRINPDTGAVAAVDTALLFAGGDPNAAANPLVSGGAYTMSTSDGGINSTTTLYDVDTALDVLVTQNPPNNGTLNTIGSLGIDATTNLGFDIVVEGGVDKAYIVTNPGNAAASSLYSVNLATGAATLIGAVGGNVLRGLTHSL